MVPPRRGEPLRLQRCISRLGAKTAKERGAILRRWFDLMMANQEIWP